MEEIFLETYSGETTAELLAMKNTHRIDSLVLAFEQAIQDKDTADVSEAENYVLAIEAMEREVNNGGWAQFFDNTENEFNEVLAKALADINCPKTAELFNDALAAKDSGDDLDEFDDRYYSLGEPIADRLFEYIERNSAGFNLN
jgi:hypothetical protein